MEKPVEPGNTAAVVAPTPLPDRAAAEEVAGRRGAGEAAGNLTLAQIVAIGTVKVSNST
jgi:hypothetical protein